MRGFRSTCAVPVTLGETSRLCLVGTADAASWGYWGTERETHLGVLGVLSRQASPVPGLRWRFSEVLVQVPPKNKDKELRLGLQGPATRV